MEPDMDHVGEFVFAVRDMSSVIKRLWRLLTNHQWRLRTLDDLLQVQVRIRYHFDMAAGETPNPETLSKVSALHEAIEKFEDVVESSDYEMWRAVVWPVTSRFNELNAHVNQALQNATHGFEE